MTLGMGHRLLTMLQLRGAAGLQPLAAQAAPHSRHTRGPAPVWAGNQAVWLQDETKTQSLCSSAVTGRWVCTCACRAA
jgi:hypothetical protein